MNESLTARRARVAASLPLQDGILVVGAGEPIPLPEGSDQTYPFRAHAEYVYLSGCECPGGVLAYDPEEGAEGWTSFVPAVTEAERVWEGRTQNPGRLIGELPSWLAQRKSRPLAALGASVSHAQAHPELSAQVRAALTHARREKESGEIARLRRATAATEAGYAGLPQWIRPGATERQIQVELEAAFFRGGGDRTGYGTIVGSGPNSAVLHVAPSHRVIREGEFVLVDAGAEVERYTADVTRTYVAGRPSSFQRELYAVVLAAEEAAIARCVTGAEWKAIHLATAVDLTAGLVALGILRGEPTSLVEQEAHTLFFPHGVGHMVGLGVRDAGGLEPGRTKDSRPGLRTLRMDLPLRPNYCVTIEPGLYFIPPLLSDPARRARYRGAVNWPRVDGLLDIGGVRIEDNLLITPGAPEVLTRNIPKSLAD